MTLAEFLDWDPADKSGRLWQLIDGEPVAMAPGSEDHAALQGETAAVIRNHLLSQRSKCRMLTEAGIVPRLRASRNYRVPDITVTCAPPGGGQTVAEPVLLVEILSPGNDALTRSNM